MTDRGMTPELIWRLALLLFVLPFSGPTTAAPQVGELAPPWTLSGSDGQQHSLAELRGQHVVIAFFPKAYTSGWTVECKALRDSDQEIRRFQVAYFMASVDSLEDNTGFAEKNGATFPILADPSKAMASAYGVLGSHGYANRWTYYIDPAGFIVKIDKDVNPLRAGVELVENLVSLGVPEVTADAN